MRAVSQVCFFHQIFQWQSRPAFAIPRPVREHARCATGVANESDVCAGIGDAANGAGVSEQGADNIHIAVEIIFEGVQQNRFAIFSSNSSSVNSIGSRRAFSANAVTLFLNSGS